MHTAEVLRNCHLSQISDASVHFQNRQIVIWGTHGTGIEGKEILESLGFKCEAFVSSRPKADCLCGIPVLTPDILNPKEYYVIVATLNLEVNRYLIERGFDEENGTDYIRLNQWHDDLEWGGCFVGRGTYGFQTLLPSESALDVYVKKIGRFCSINNTAKIWENHSMNFVSTHPFLDKLVATPPSKKIRSIVEGVIRKVELVEIGNDVWIGAGVIILPGVKICDGAIIGAGAVVTQNVAPYAIVGGVPAKTIKYRYPQEMIDSFLRIKWWEWPISKIEKSVELFYCPEDFCRTFDRQFTMESTERKNNEE